MLFNLFMFGVFAAVFAKLLEQQLLFDGFLVACREIIHALAFRTFQFSKIVLGHTS